MECIRVLNKYPCRTKLLITDRLKYISSVSRFSNFSSQLLNGTKDRKGLRIFGKLEKIDVSFARFIKVRSLGNVSWNITLKSTEPTRLKNFKRINSGAPGNAFTETIVAFFSRPRFESGLVISRNIRPIYFKFFRECSVKLSGPTFECSFFFITAVFFLV